MREHGTFSRSNKTSVPYNPISLEYDAGCDGDRLRFSDDTLRYRSALRADHLQAYSGLGVRLGLRLGSGLGLCNRSRNHNRNRDPTCRGE